MRRANPYDTRNKGRNEGRKEGKPGGEKILSEEEHIAMEVAQQPEPRALYRLACGCLVLEDTLQVESEVYKRSFSSESALPRPVDTCLRRLKALIPGDKCRKDLKMHSKLHSLGVRMTNRSALPMATVSTHASCGMQHPIKCVCQVFDGHT